MRMSYGQEQGTVMPRKEGTMSKDRGQKAAKKPAASTAKEKKAAKREKNQAASSVLNNRK